MAYLSDKPKGITIEIPGRAPLCLTRLVLDYNGTLALDGSLLPGVIYRLQSLLDKLHIDVITADTHQSARDNLEWTGLLPRGINLVKLPAGQNEDDAKGDYLREHAPERCCAVGNGVNDAQMLGCAALSIAVIGSEGCAREALNAAMIAVTDIEDALDLFLFPKRLIATLRR